MTTAGDIYTLSFPNAKNIVVSGDIHGKFNQLVHKLCVQYAMRDTLLIVAGDCGFGFDNPGYYDEMVKKNSRRMSEANNWIVFVRGNHDNPAYFDGETNTAGNNVSAILRLAFDCGKYGQARVAANAINAKVRVRWNWNASSTVQRVRKFFAKNIADGTLSRVSFATIVKTSSDRYGRNRPKYLAYGDSFADELHPYIDRLTTCTGTLVCPEAQAWAERLCDELSDFAEEVKDETYATMSFRAVLMGFLPCYGALCGERMPVEP